MDFKRDIQRTYDMHVGIHGKEAAYVKTRSDVMSLIISIRQADIPGDHKVQLLNDCIDAMLDVMNKETQ